MEKKTCMNRILVVDGNVDILLLLKKRLENEGYEVLTAGNGVEAQEVIQQNPPCVVILDLMMPVMDGWQFLDWKKEQAKELADLPVLVVSAVSNNFKAPEGIAGFLRKPVSVTHMIDSIQAYC
jgi:two-component system chemotaxis response regulator CheY